MPDFHAHHRQHWEDQVDLWDADAKNLFARVHWERFLHNARQDRYREALSLVAERWPAR